MLTLFLKLHFYFCVLSRNINTLFSKSSKPTTHRRLLIKCLSSLGQILFHTDESMLIYQSNLYFLLLPFSQVVVESPVRPLRSLVRLCFIFLLFLSTFIVIILLGFPDSSFQTDWWKNLSLYTYYHRWTNSDRPLGPSTTTIPPTTVPATPSTTIRPLPTDHYHLGYPRNYHFIVDEPDKCNTQTPFLVLIVPVAPGNLAARDAIRRTWGNETLVQGKKVQTLFMLGLPGGPNAQELQEKVGLDCLSFFLCCLF